jgi:nucleotide-binding universal stress UspA family protein
LHIVGVVRPPEFAEDVETEAIVESSERKIQGLLRTVKAQATASGVEAEAHVVVGHPAEKLVIYAEAHGIDHIVVGHRGHTVFERWLIGSVARQVIAYAHCAVTVVRTSE